MLVGEAIRILTNSYKLTDEIAVGYWMDEKRLQFLCERFGVSLNEERTQILLAAIHSKLVDHRRDIENLINVEMLIKQAGDNCNQKPLR